MKNFPQMVLGLALMVLVSVTTSKAADDLPPMPCDLGPLMDIPTVWALTPEKLDQLFPMPEGAKRNPYYQWLTADHSRALFMRHRFTNMKIDLTILDKTVPVEEAVVDFQGGKLNGITFSIYNRGDSGALDISEVQRRSTKCNEALRKSLNVVPTPAARRSRAGPALAGVDLDFHAGHGQPGV